MHDVRIPGGVGSLFSEELDLSSEEREKILRIEGSMRSSQLRALYFSQFLSGFGDRVWQFAIPFFLLALQRPDSLTFAVFYALVTGFTNIACGPIVSYSVEKFGRLQTITACMLVQITFVSLSFLLTYIALSLSSRWMGTLGFLMLLLTASCSIGSLASFGSTFAIERDWIRCLNNGNEVDIIKSENVLAKISVACRVAAPIFVAVILACLSPSLAALSIALWDLVAVMIEYSILRSIYVTNPRLAAPKEQQKKRKGPAAMSPTQTLVRVAGRQRWFLAYQASWREYLDLDGDGMISSTELSYGVRVGVLRCWDLWIGCICGAGLFVYIRRILALPYAA
mmetsp:Transcript_7525/g.17416  ORF Transcript_7525/g.17416 Transcript_7525/m.17416 type:complete len:339 (+) Transcript_7525:2-1018(+)